MEPTPPTPPSEQTAGRPEKAASTYAFAAALATLGAAVAAAASVLPYATSASVSGHLVDLDLPFKEWVWAALLLWGTALAILLAASSLVAGEDHRMLGAGVLIGLGVETMLIYLPVLGDALVRENVDPSTGSYLGPIAGAVVLASGMVASRGWRATR
jgi:hypothetical protein